jgi:acyl carrier protein
VEPALTTLERLRSILHRDFDIDPDALQPQVRLDALDIDSLRMIEILFAVEDEFGIRIPAEQAKPNEALQSVADLCGFVDAQVAAQGGDALARPAR